MKPDRTRLEYYRKQLGEGARGLPGVWREPKAVLAWGKDNPRIPAAMAGLFLTVLLVLPVADFALEKIYHPVARKELFGLVSSIEEDARLAPRKAQVRWLLWTAALAGSIGLFLFHVPGIRSYLSEGKGRDEVEGERTAPDGYATVAQETAPNRAVGPGGRYLVTHEAGRGAMGVVYAARDTVLDREVAIKELPHHLAADAGKYERFRREARALANLSNPTVVQIYDLLEEGGAPYLVMELVKGGNLQELLDGTASLPLERACRLGASIARALAYVHGKGIVHRDLKPANILLTEAGEPRITDFGVARWAHETGLTLEGSLIGSPNYMSPEQAAGKTADARSDLYSFGVLLYRLLAGSAPYSGDVPAILSQHMTATPDPPSARNGSVSEDLDAVVLSLMARDPGDREGDLEKVAAALETAALRQGSVAK